MSLCMEGGDKEVSKISNKKNYYSPYDKQHNKRRRGITLYRVLA